MPRRLLEEGGSCQTAGPKAGMSGVLNCLQHAVCSTLKTVLFAGLHPKPHKTLKGVAQVGYPLHGTPIVLPTGTLHAALERCPIWGGVAAAGEAPD